MELAATCEGVLETDCSSAAAGLRDSELQPADLDRSSAAGMLERPGAC